jgi:ATP-dependent protease Clp ATPase subunit
MYINNDIEPTIAKLREHYKNDNSFKSYINILAVITSHFKTLDKQIYQTLTKSNIFVNQQVQEVRENNELSDFKKSLIWIELLH